MHKNQLPIHDLHYIYTFRCLVCPWPFFAGPYTHAERGAVARPIAQTDMPGSCYRILLRLRFRLDHAPHPPRILFFFVLQDREGGIQIAAAWAFQRRRGSGGRKTDASCSRAVARTRGFASLGDSKNRPRVLNALLVCTCGSQPRLACCIPGWGPCSRALARASRPWLAWFGKALDTFSLALSDHPDGRQACL